MDTVFIVDVYNKYLNPETVRQIFKIHDEWYCIREVTLNWGKPKLNYYDDDFLDFHLYDTYKEALEYVHYLKRLETSK